MEEALKKALQWWNDEAKYLTEWRGDGTSGDEYNVFDETPEWVAMARIALSNTPK